LSAPWRVIGIALLIPAVKTQLSASAQIGGEDVRLKQLETFYWAARLGSLANAAKKLNSTQSAVSMRIRELETQLGVILFDRSQRTVRLTPDGVNLLPFAEQIVQNAERIETFARNKAISGYVRLGVAEIIAHTWLPQFLQLLYTNYPLVQVELEVGVSHLLEDKMREGALDMSLATFELPASSFVSTYLGAVAFEWMKSPARRDIPDIVDARTIEAMPMILTSREVQHRGSILDWLSDNDVRFRSLTICNTFTTAAALAKTGLGIALLPRMLYEQDLADGALHELTCRPPLKPLGIICSRSRHAATPAYRAVEWAASSASTFDGKVEVPPP
jgi:DNA-binding transcriptional LysR family regulator